MIISKSELKAWRDLHKFDWEINLCIQEQYPYNENPSDEDCLMLLDVFGRLMKEFVETYDKQKESLK